MLNRIPPYSWLRRPRLIVALLALIASAASPAAGQSSASNPEDALKAGFLYNFAKFTNWPHMDDLDMSINFCVERDTLAPPVFEGWGRKQIKKRPVRVTFFSEADPVRLRSCDIVFIRTIEGDEELDALMELAKKNGILTVSDTEGFGKRGGHIELYLADRKLRFRVNLESLDEADLSLGAGLLRLAEIVTSS